MNQLSVQALADWLADASREPPLVLDVREPWEVEKASMAGITAIPMHEIPARVGELDRARDIVAVCHHGGRSMQVAMYLQQQGFTRLSNLTGGMDAWSREVDPRIPRY
jgi:rhodanese-related sulfurtransferase